MEWLIFCIIAVVLLIIYFNIRKVPKCGALTLTNGGVKTGKSAFSVHLAIRYYKKHLSAYRIKCIFIKFLKFLRIPKFVKMEMPERPLLYSNIPLGDIPYVELTEDLLKRKKRFAYKSVILVDEMSLIADSQMFKDMDLNERLMFFFKLIGHETRGGKLFYDTQSIGDLHYSAKRTLSSYFYIHHMIKLPFICLMWIREERYSDDGAITNTYQGDVEDSLKLYIMPKSVFKRYDQYAYSYLTDYLEVEDNEIIADGLKANTILSFKKWRTIEKDRLLH